MKFQLADKYLLSESEVIKKLHLEDDDLLNWYAWKLSYPNNKLSKSLPMFIWKGAEMSGRYWRPSDLNKLVAFGKKYPKRRQYERLKFKRRTNDRKRDN